MILAPAIRLACSADASDIARMSREYIEHGLGWSWTSSRILAAIRDESTNVAVVYERGRVIGFAIMQYGDRTAHLSLLGVAPAQRRRGLGGRMVAWLEKCADTAGIERIRVEARSDNPLAIAFYQKLGYQVSERMSGYYRGLLDAIRLEKTLRAPISEPPP
jgi:ribosomal protein S18 acetylase RimI-like enzyme